MKRERMLIEGAERVESEAESSVPRVVGEARLLCADRRQLRLLPTDLDALLEPDHRARAIWTFLEKLDLSAFRDRVRSVEGRAGRPAIDPTILLTLWVYAISQGVGSARMLASLCNEHVVYRWICGGVSVTRTPLTEFRVQHGEEIDTLLTQTVGILMSQGLVKLERTAQDGVRVRASAGASSFRRRRSLERCLDEARKRVRELRDELDADPAEGTRRQRAAQERASRERTQRVQDALDQWDEVRKRKSLKKGDDPEEKVRVSTTDPDARVMKMADGGFRPAINVQVTSDVGSQVILGVDITNSGGDMGQMAPMLDQLKRRHGQLPKEHLADGGFANPKAIADAAERGCTVYAPEPEPRRQKGQPKYQVGEPRPDDPPEVAEWRRRMQTEEAKQIYRERAGAIECVNALLRNRGLTRLLVRGLQRIRANVTLYAVAHNVLRALTLPPPAAAAAVA